MAYTVALAGQLNVYVSETPIAMSPILEGDRVNPVSDDVVTDTVYVAEAALL
jgi:hypothetical protein